MESKKKIKRTRCLRLHIFTILEHFQYSKPIEDAIGKRFLSSDRIILWRAWLLPILSALFLVFSFSEAFSGKIPEGLISRNLKKLDQSLIIQPKELEKKIDKKENIHLVDIRQRELFDKSRIPNSINVPLYFIKTKTFLKESLIILIDRGDQYAHMEIEAKKLKELGFDALMLYGGINEWMNQGYPIEGNSEVRNELQEISPPTFFMEKNYDHWLVIDLTESQDAREILPQSLSIPLSKDASQFIKQMKKAHKQNSSYPFILLVGKDGKEAEHVESVVLVSSMKNVYFLTGGADGYRKFLVNLAESKDLKNARPKKVATSEKKKGCGSG